MSDRNYLLLTPGPLTTSDGVKQAMLFDSCTWDEDYNLGVVQSIRRQLVALATQSAGYTAVLLQGSGSFAVEGVLGTVIGPQDKLLIVNNGAYGARMAEMARLMDIGHRVFDCGEVNEPDVAALEAVLKSDARISISPWCTVRPPPACLTRCRRWPGWRRATAKPLSSTP